MKYTDLLAPVCAFIVPGAFLTAVVLDSLWPLGMALFLIWVASRFYQALDD